MDHLAPTPLVSTLANPLIPETQSALKRALIALIRERLRKALVLTHIFEEKVGRLALMQCESRRHAPCSILAQGNRRGQRQRQPVALKDRPVLQQAGLVLIASIIKGGPAGQNNLQRAIDDVDRADQGVLKLVRLASLDGHEIGQFRVAIMRSKTRQQNIRIGIIELLILAGHVGGMDAEEAPFLRVEQCAKDARRVDAWKTIPIDRAILAHQRHRMQIPDNRIVTDRQVGGRGWDIAHSEKPFLILFKATVWPGEARSS